MIKIAVFASGSGSNAAAIADYFDKHPNIELALLVTNNPQAGVIEKGKKRNIPVLIIKNEQLNSSSLVDELKEKEIGFIVLAGFLRLIPGILIQNYPDKILNIHPALLPKYGGKGMYGINIHKAVANSNDKKSGLTIHLVNNEYDKGRILFQKEVALAPTDGPNEIAAKVLSLEHQHYPEVIERYVVGEGEI